MKLTLAELEKYRHEPFKCSYPCHTQSVEHGVAAVSRSAKRRRTERTQLINVLQTAYACKNNPGQVTKKRKLNSGKPADSAEVYFTE